MKFYTRLVRPHSRAGPPSLELVNGLEPLTCWLQTVWSAKNRLHSGVYSPFRSIIARHLTLNFPLCPHSFFAVWVGVWVKPQSTSGKAIKRKPKSLLKICAAKLKKGFYAQWNALHTDTEHSIIRSLPFCRSHVKYAIYKGELSSANRSEERRVGKEC